MFSIFGLYRGPYNLTCKSSQNSNKSPLFGHLTLRDFRLYKVHSYLLTVLNAGFLQSDQVQRYIYKINWLNIKSIEDCCIIKINQSLFVYIYLSKSQLSPLPLPPILSGVNFRKLAAHSVIFASSVL